MALPELIEINPSPESVLATVTVPGSKSITNRALILAALGRGNTRLDGALWSEDTQVMVACLQKLGFRIVATPDPREPCNRSILIQGAGGIIPQSSSPSAPVDLFVGNAGTAARFLAAFVCLGKGPYRLHGVPRMHQRPQSSLFRALRDLGYHIETSAGHDRLPATIHGHGPRQGRCQVSIVESSQFASALMLCAQAGGWEIEVVGENAEESPYVAMTTELIKKFRGHGTFSEGDRSFQIEPDASSGSYFWAAHFIRCPADVSPAEWKRSQPVLDWPASGWQIDASFPRYWPLPSEISREGELADSIMSAMMLAPFASTAVRFTDLGRLRVQESERVSAVRTELSKCGGDVLEKGDSLTIHPGHLHGAEIETYEDHRIAMCFSILGLKVPGIKIKNPACVKKTFPNFFQKLAAPTPRGLGVKIFNAQTDALLSNEQLFAS